MKGNDDKQTDWLIKQTSKRQSIIGQKPLDEAVEWLNHIDHSCHGMRIGIQSKCHKIIEVHKHLSRFLNFSYKFYLLFISHSKQTHLWSIEEKRSTKMTSGRLTPSLIRNFNFGIVKRFIHVNITVPLFIQSCYKTVKLLH